MHYDTFAPDPHDSTHTSTFLTRLGEKKKKNTKKEKKNPVHALRLKKKKKTNVKQACT